MDAIKTHPTHKLTFAAHQSDASGRNRFGPPVEVGAVWPRREGKRGGILRWNFSPANLGEGQYRLHPNDIKGQALVTDIPMAHQVSFAEKRDDLARGSQLSRPVTVADVRENGVVDWAIPPGQFSEGVFFVLEKDRTQRQETKDGSARSDALDQITEKQAQTQKGLAR